MTTPQNRFTVPPLLVAFFAALAWLPATTVVNVSAQGMGLEHEQPWRQRCNGLVSSAGTCLTAVAKFGRTLERIQRHEWFRPVIATGLMCGVALVDSQWLIIAPFVVGATLTEGQHAGEFIVSERLGVGHPSRDNVTVLSGQNLSAGAVVSRVSKGVGRMSVPTVVGTGNGTVSLVFGGPDTLVGNYVVTCTATATHGGTFSVVNPAGKALPSLVMTPGAGGSTVYRSREINFTITDGSTDFAANDVFTFVVSTTAPTVVGTGNGTVSSITMGADAKPGNYRLEITAAITNGGEFKLTGPDGDIVEQGFIVAGAGGTFVGANKRQINFTLTEGSTDFAVADAFNILVFNELNGGKVVAWDPTAVDGRDDAVGVLYDNVNASSGDLAGVILARDAAVLKSALQWGAAITAAQKEWAYRDLASRGIVAR